MRAGADKLAARFSPVTGTTRSWDFGKWKWPVIIDNMMNLEMDYADGLCCGYWIEEV